MSKCLKGIPFYTGGSNFATIQQQVDIDKGLKEAPTATEEELIEQFTTVATNPSFETNEEALNSLGTNPEEKNEWRDKQTGHKRIYNTPNMKELAKKREDGELYDTDWIDAVKEHNPPVSYESTQQIPTYKEIVKAVQQPQKGIINTGGSKADMPTNQMKKLPDGMPVSSRLDITSYKKYDTWVVTLHTASGNFVGGKVIGYAKSAHLKNVKFIYSDTQKKKAMKIAQGGAKGVIASFEGSWANTPTTEVSERINEVMSPDSGWVQVGMNPERGEYFYNKSNMRPLASAEEVLQVGPVLMARGVKYLKREDLGNTSKRAEPFVFQDDNEFTVMPTEIQPDGERLVVGTISAEPWDVNGATDYTVSDVQMNNGFLGKGKGVELYLTMVEELLKKGVHMGGFGRVPDYFSSGGSTTESAMRVWRSIYKNLDKHLEKFPNLKGAILLMPSNEKGMTLHSLELMRVSEGIAKVKDGVIEDNYYEQDVGQEPAFSIELYPEIYKKNVAKNQ
jgi:hypothetical protein